MGLYFFLLGSSRSPGSTDQSPHFHFKVLQETEQNRVEQLGGADALTLNIGSLGRLLNQPKDCAAAHWGRVPLLPASSKEGIQPGDRV